jgi:RNA polymerase sigma-70 factor (ECF subfamily)
MSRATERAAEFQAHRALLFSIAYRMLGSADEADDVLQDAFLRYESAAVDEIRSTKAFLSMIVTRLCLNELKSARATRQSYVGQWLPEPIRTEELVDRNDPERRAVDADSISIAFVSLLQNLTPAERAVFLLREVFDYGYDEIARMLDKSEAACRQLFSRARHYVAENRPRFAATPAQHRRILEAFMHAAGTGDLDALTSVLTEDVVFWADGGGKVSGAALNPVRGRAAVLRFVLGLTQRFMPANATFGFADINGRPTILVRNPNGGASFVVSVEIDHDRIESVWAIANPDKLRRLST